MRSSALAAFAAGTALLLSASGCEERGDLGASKPRPAPHFALTDLDGETLGLPDLRGRTAVIGFWSRDCESCVQQPAELNRVHGRHRESEEVVVLDIEVGQASADEVRRWGETHGAVADYRQLVGADDKLARVFGAAMLPTSFVLAPDGSIDATLLGIHSAEAIEEAIAHVDRGRWQRPLAPAPGFVYPDLDGELLRLTDLRGKTVVIDFWATWCPESVHQPAELNRLQEALGESAEVVVLGVEVGGATAHQVRSWSHQHRATARYRQLIGARAEEAMLFGVPGFPTTVVVAPDGSVQSVLVGFHLAEELLAEIAHLIRPAT